MEVIEEQKLKVAIQGVEGCFHHSAAEKFYKQSVDIHPAESFEELIHIISSGRCDRGLMAIENTIAGNIVPNYSLLEKSDLFICGEVSIPIEQHLMGLSGASLDTIDQIQSHPIAIQQCLTFLQKHPHISVLESSDTALSAKQIVELETKNIAAIAGQRAAEVYGLQILQRNIETQAGNKTRFLVLSRSENKKSEKHNKASVLFTPSYKYPSLTETIYAICSTGVKLLKIQNTDTSIHIDISFDGRTQMENALTALESRVDFTRVLGIYKQEDQ